MLRKSFQPGKGDNKSGDYFVQDEYNGVIIREHNLSFSSTQESDKFPRCSAKLKSSAQENFGVSKNEGFGNMLKTFIMSVFLPQGYPQTVTDDYLCYQTWDTVQAFASSISAALATSAVFKGVGVGSGSASVLAASITWLLKDGTGMIGRIVFAWAKGTALDSDCKKWRLVADVLNDFAFCLDLTSTSPIFFTPIACTSSLLRSIVGVAGGATRTAIVRHQARRDNLADVAAKDGSQETVVNLLSLVMSLILLPILEGNATFTWICFGLCTVLHLFANYRAVRSLHLDVLNRSRFALCVKSFVENGDVLSIEECNKREPIFSSGNGPRFYGCSYSKVPRKPAVIYNYKNDGFLCAYAKERDAGYVVLETDATDEEMFRAAFQIEWYSIAERWPDASTEKIFREKLHEFGWQIHAHQLNFDEWRIRCAKKEN